jgi:hypothetical protein
MEYQDKYEELLAILLNPIDLDRDGKKFLLREEFEKLYVRDNKISGTRIRKFMQILRRKAEEIREDVQNHRDML